MKHKYVIRLLQNQIRAFERAAEDADKFAAKEYIANLMLIHAAIYDLMEVSLHTVPMALPDKSRIGVKQSTYKIGDKIRMTTLTCGEIITDRKGKPIHQTPSKNVYEGVVKFAGPEGAFEGAVEVVRCNGGNKALKPLNPNYGFQFYPKDNGPEQAVEVLMPAQEPKP
jgi:hypothetical protein